MKKIGVIMDNQGLSHQNMQYCVGRQVLDHVSFQDAVEADDEGLD